MRRLKRQLLSRPKLARLLLLIFVVFPLAGALFYFLIFPLPRLIHTGTQIVLNQNPFSLKNDNGRTNILILGTGGAEHDGPNLTDTMIIISAVTKFDDKTATTSPITLISIPRDIYIDSINNKINAAYDLAGLPLTKEIVGQVTGLPIHYAAKIDFSVFEKVIDILGGLDVNVTNVLDDYYYPIDGKENDNCGLTQTAVVIDEVMAAKAYPCRYEHLHFDAGLQHMDGKTALKYVRSRHADWPEGSDFARSKRQQIVIKAVKDKAFSGTNFLNVSKDLEIYNQIRANIDTDFDFSQPQALLAFILKYQGAQFKNISLDDQVLVNPPQDQRGWILLPKNGSWDEVHSYIKNSLEDKQTSPQAN